MFFSNLNSNLKPKIHSEYFPNCKVISEYGYTEDMNFRMTMEDGDIFTHPLILIHLKLKRTFRL